MIGAWAITDAGFATLNASGAFQTLADTSTSLGSATSIDHVYVQATASLAADQTIASLRGSDNSVIDLGGKRLTIQSGGIFRNYEIKNGQLTAGDGGSAEVVIHQNRGIVSADIIDNPSGGPVSLVVSDGRTQLSGQNSYTGGTWVVGSGDLTSTFADGQLEIMTLSAIPANDRVFIDHGIYNISAITSGIVRLSELHLRGGGIVRAHANAPIDADKIFVESGLLSTALTGDGSIVKDTAGSVSFSNDKSPDFTGTFLIRDGYVSANDDTFPQAKFTVEGGQLDILGDRSSANSVTLKGGIIGSGRFTGSVEIQSDSILSHNDTTSFFGNVSGDGNLTIRGRQDAPFNRYVGFFGNATGFSGDIRIESGAFRLGTSNRAGTGVIYVDEAARLILRNESSSNPALSIDSEIHVLGGTIYGMPLSSTSLSNIATTSVLTGNVYVDGDAFIGALQNGVHGGRAVPGLAFAGKLVLPNDSHVYGLSDSRSQVAQGNVALVEVSGELLVGEDTTWHLLTSSLAISGAIRPQGTKGSIDFVGMRDLLKLHGADIRVDEGQSLAVHINGATSPLDFDGVNATLSGAGTIVGDFAVSGGASVAPGSSPGILTIDGSLSLGSGGSLKTEIAGPRAGSEHDQLNVVGSVLLNGGELDISVLDGFKPTPDQGFVLLRTASITGKFSNALDSILVGDQMMPLTYRSQMVILGNAAAIPEPASLVAAMALLGLAGLGVRPNRRRIV